MTTQKEISGGTHFTLKFYLNSLENVELPLQLLPINYLMKHL